MTQPHVFVAMADSFGDTAGETEPPTSGMVALADDLQAIECGLAGN